MMDFRVVRAWLEGWKMGWKDKGEPKRKKVSGKGWRIIEGKNKEEGFLKVKECLWMVLVGSMCGVLYYQVIRRRRKIMRSQSESKRGNKGLIKPALFL